MQWFYSVTLVLILGWTCEFSKARGDKLFTSSVTYCADPDALIISAFDVTYFRSNTSIAVTVSATNVAPDLNATANVVLNDYGDVPFNFTFDFCNVFDGVLCPLPRYNFTGNAMITLPPTFRFEVPAIAFRIPDLEAVAQLILRRVENNKVAVCIQSTLSNGWSLHQPMVSTATGWFAFVTLLLSIARSFFRPASSPSVFRAVDLFQFFQYVASSAMLHLNYPSCYIAFATNFAWSLGLFSGSNSIQHAIERMRHLSGSTSSEGPVEPIDYADRNLSPYNLAKAFDAQSGDIPEVDVGGILGGTDKPPDISGHDFITPAIVTSDANTLPPGIPIYVNYMDVATGSAFMTAFFTVLFLLLSFAAAMAAIFIIIKYLGDKRQVHWAKTITMNYWTLFVSNGLRIIQITIFPMMLFAFFQWTLHDSWLAILISVITLLSYSAAIIYPTYLLIRHSRNFNLIDAEMVNSPQLWSGLTAPFLAKRNYSYIISIFVLFLRSCFISFGKDNGFIQVVGLTVVEVLYFIVLVFLRPGRTRRSDFMAIFLSFVRIITTAALLPFEMEKLAVNAIPRAAIGIVIAVICSVAILMVLLDQVVNALPWRSLFTRRGKKEEASIPSETVVSEQDTKDISSEKSEETKVA